MPAKEPKRVDLLCEGRAGKWLRASDALRVTSHRCPGVSFCILAMRRVASDSVFPRAFPQWLWETFRGVTTRMLDQNATSSISGCAGEKMETAIAFAAGMLLTLIALALEDWTRLSKRRNATLPQSARNNWREWPPNMSSDDLAQSKRQSAVWLPERKSLPGHTPAWRGEALTSCLANPRDFTSSS